MRREREAQREKEHPAEWKISECDTVDGLWTKEEFDCSNRSILV
jgi:hypothetical protein